MTGTQSVCDQQTSSATPYSVHAPAQHYIILSIYLLICYYASLSGLSVMELYTSGHLLPHSGDIM